MGADLVLGIDSSTTATKAIAWTADGRPMAEGRAPVPMAEVRPGWFEQGVEDWWRSLARALRALFAQIEPSRIAALAITNQRETIGFLDRGGEELRPAILWLDERCREDVELLAARVGAGRFREITGKTPDITPAIFAAHWVRRHEPERWAKLGALVDVHGYLVWRLTGERRTSWASADPHGFLDIATKRYHPELLAALGIDAAQLFTPERPGALLGRVGAEAARETGLLAGTPVFAGGGDGQAAGLGAGVLAPGRAYLNLGTAAVSGVYGRAPRTDRAFRTLTALDGEGYIYELCLRTGAFLTDWMVQRVFGLDPAGDPDCYRRLEAEAAAIPPGADGLLLLPYWSGVMAPHWNPDACGAIVGLRVEHRRGHLYRALMEGIALDLAAGYRDIEEAIGETVEELTLLGGGARSGLWRQIIADASGRPAALSATIEATCLGAAMLAAHGAGFHATLAEAAGSMAGRVEERQLPGAAAEVYAALLESYRALYPALEGMFLRLAALRREVGR